jgi:hypothetical protein
VTGYVFRGYANYGTDIIERDKDIKLSMEISVNDLSYDATNKVYNITDFKYLGITFLNKDFGTGMENAMATTETFAQDDYKEKFIEIMTNLKEVLSPKEAKEEQKAEEVNSKLPEEKFVKSFELSHEDIRYALYQLLVIPETEDNEWYFIDHVYDDKFEYINWEGTKIYRQGYAKDGDNIKFDGDRIELFQERLTKEEKEALDNMRSSYASIKSEFDTYKSEYITKESEVKELRTFKENKVKEERDSIEKEIFEKFTQLNGNEEFEALKEHSSEYDIKTLEDRCFSIFGRTKANFSLEKKSKSTVKVQTLPMSDNDKDIYQRFFDEYGKDNK